MYCKIPEKQDINYCYPRKDTPYCWKSEDGETMFKPRHYLLHTIQEVVAAHKEEQQEATTYYQMTDVIANKRYCDLGSHPWWWMPMWRMQEQWATARGNQVTLPQS